MEYSRLTANIGCVTPAGRGKGRKKVGSDDDDRGFAERHAAMTWAQRLKRVFNIDIETCEKCQGPVRIIACVEDPAVIRQILDHLALKDTSAEQVTLPPGRARTEKSHISTRLGFGYSVYTSYSPPLASVSKVKPRLDSSCFISLPITFSTQDASRPIGCSSVGSTSKL